MIGMKRESWIYYYLRGIKERISFCKFKAEWRKNNQHNATIPGVVFPVERVRVGKMTYGEVNVYGFDRPDTTLTIGNYCSIAGEVQFWIGGEHPINFLSTFPFAYKYGWDEYIHPEFASKGSINIKDDVWIGERAIILSGVTIGQGAVVGAGSVVTKDIPPYSIYAGGKIVKQRFAESIISELVKFDYGDLDVDVYKDVCDIELTIDNFTEVLNKLRK